MNIRRMIPMGTVQRTCIVCGYPINATSTELTAHELQCINNLTEGGENEKGITGDRDRDRDGAG